MQFYPLWFRFRDSSPVQLRVADRAHLLVRSAASKLNRPTWSLLDALLAPLRADTAAIGVSSSSSSSSHASAADAEMTEAVSSSSAQSPPLVCAALDPTSNGSLGATASMSAVDAAARIASFDLFHLFALLERALPYYATPSNGGSQSARDSGHSSGSTDSASARFDRAFHLRHALRVLLAFRAAQTVAHALAARSGTVAPPWLQRRLGQASTASAASEAAQSALSTDPPLIDEQHAHSAKWTTAFDAQRASADVERGDASETLESDRRLSAHVLRLARCAANPAMNVNEIGASASETGADLSDWSHLSTACCGISAADLTSHLLPLLRQAALLLHVCDVGFALSSASADDSGAASARGSSSSGSALPAAAPALRRLLSNIADAPVSLTSSAADGTHSHAERWMRAPTHVEREFAALANAIGLPLSVGDLLGVGTAASATSSGRCEPVDSDAAAARRVFAQSLHAIWQFEAAERSTLIYTLRLGGNMNGTDAHLSAPVAASANLASLHPTAERRLVAARSLPLLRLAPAALIPLPRDYSDLFQWLTDARCAQCQTVPREPALCLVCGQLLCAATPCCRSNSQGARRIFFFASLFI